jgi:hypothetical protein
MTSDASLERLLVAVLADEAAVGDGEVAIDRILTVTRGQRPRPRWLALLKEPPMRTTAALQAGSSGLRRGLILVAALALVLVGMLVVSAGSSLLRTPGPSLPPPFGIAANGRLVFAHDGDLYVAAAPDAAAVPLITAPGDDASPVFSRDGTRVAYRHQDGGQPAQLVIARADGTGIVPITAWPDRFDWSPDGRALALLRDPGPGAASISVVATDGVAQERVLDLGGVVPTGWVAWRPRDGHELLFTASPQALSPDVGIYAVSPDGGPARVVVPPAAPIDANATPISDLELSPDGRSLTYWLWGPDIAGEVDAWAHIRAIDTGVERISHDIGGTHALFTPDGRFLVGDNRSQLAIEPVDGSAPARLFGPTFETGPHSYGLAPDGTTLYLTFEDSGVTWIVDLATGGSRRATATITTLPTQQRLALAEGAG